ncbi:T9SS type A sorting domain-containing protein [candidate division KSB1 bacterium]|nr:T9SS type A sorting domain-containing protein [candidate division KSB1 bacterium]
MKRFLIVVCLGMSLLTLLPTEVVANTSLSFMRIGRLWMICEYDGAEGWSGQCAWPGGYLNFPDAISREMWGANVRKLGTIAGCKNWTGPDSLFYPYWTSGMYRTYDYDYADTLKPITDLTQLFPVSQKLIRRWLRPKISVNGEDITPSDELYADNIINGTPWQLETQVDPTLVTELAVESIWDYSMGVTYRRMAYAFSNQKHQDYILWDITLTNTGNISGTQLPELANQTIQDFWWTQTGNPWTSRLGRDFSFGADDAEGEFIQPFGDEHRFYLFYDGDHAGDGVSDWGDPSKDPRWIRLLSPAYIAYGPLHVDKSVDDASDDPTQPRCTLIGHERDYDLSKQVKTMQEQYEVLFNEGSHWQLDTPHREIDPSIIRPSGYTSIGPFNLEPGDDFNMIFVWAAGGINIQECRRLGKAAWQATYYGIIMDEIEANVKTGRDSVLKTLDRAYWNVKGHYPDGSYPKPAGNNCFDVPDAPRPPAEFRIRAEAAKIVLEWSDEAEQQPDFDTGVNDFAGYRLYRASGRCDSTYYLIWDGTARKYEDLNVVACEQYFYYLVAYDDGTQNWEDPGVSLESGRFWCWTGWIPEGVTPLPSSVSNEASLEVPKEFRLYQNYPNPFNAGTEIRFDLPAKSIVSLQIFDLAGKLVKTLSENLTWKANTHSVLWNGTDGKGNPVSSGVYLIRIQCGGFAAIKKCVMIK